MTNLGIISQTLNYRCSTFTDGLLFSGFKQLFAEGQDFSYSLEDIGRYYQTYLKLMAHWDKVIPGFVLTVKHEDVVDDLEKQVRRMLDFCGLEFEQWPLV
eukprot:TRINITY_DN18771_c0_g1_i1.p1 TRINITY_DN18771_c0_g1~~TRINITY_DN18771_c0_g1_i1.p1  ORF type:complete len:109 (+),score=19.85 TRINITY_DN18771_c0_g1_i1:28-327(+)